MLVRSCARPALSLLIALVAFAIAAPLAPAAPAPYGTNDAGGFRKLVAEAVDAATRRGRELSARGA